MWGKGRIGEQYSAGCVCMCEREREREVCEIKKNYIWKKNLTKKTTAVQ
jgi:hypothetical protein